MSWHSFLGDNGYEYEYGSDQAYKFGGKEFETGGGLNSYDFGARTYDPALCRFGQVDPLCEDYYGVSPYVYCFNNPVRFVDPDGKRPIPLNDPYNNWHVKVDSWFGSRNTGLEGASMEHRGLDFNYSGGSNTDYGTPILATHEGIATIDNNPAGEEGRAVVITSPDQSFRTRYFHLSEINVKNGEYISESDNIAKMGGSANGKDLGRISHLHYEIQKLQDNKWKSINPISDKGNKLSNIIDPQKWITPNNTIYQGKTLPEVIVTATSQAIPVSIPLLQTEKLKLLEFRTP
jgi:RHS repeat-associated protein